MPGITAWDIRQATTGQHDDLITEFTFTCERAEDLGHLTSLTSLMRLNVGFNNLTHIKGLSSLLHLQHVDISHNQVASLQPFSALTLLTSLNAGSNLIQSTRTLEPLQQLKQLLLHGNSIHQPAEVLLLSRLPSLEFLSLSNNPVCQQQTNWQLATIAMLPGLKLLDNQLISAERRQAAQPHMHSWAQAAAHAQAQAEASCSGGSNPGSSHIASSQICGRAKDEQPHCAQAEGQSNIGIFAVSFKDATALLPDIKVDALKPTTLWRQRGALQHTSVYEYSHVKPVACIHSQRYAAGRAVQAAVCVQSDGSATCTWPTAGLAVSLDAEDPGSGRSGYRLLAMYQSGSCVAASFDSTGGFAQYPSGGLMLVWNRKDGSGTAYAADGSITRFNSHKRALALQCDAEAQLNEFFSVKLLAGCADLQLTFTCEGCGLTLSLKHGAMLPDRLAANASAAMAVGTPSATQAAETAAFADQADTGCSVAAAVTAANDEAEDKEAGLAALLARARLLMATAQQPQDEAESSNN